LARYLNNQAYIFLIFIFNGFLIGLLFDIFRIARRSFKTSDFITNIEDILFWILAGISILFTIFKFNDGILRSYIFLGLLLGSLVYMLVFSKIFIKVSVSIINFIKKLFYIIIINPLKLVFKFLKRLIFGPVSFIFINLSKILSKAKINIVKICKNKKKRGHKKDFA